MRTSLKTAAAGTVATMVLGGAMLSGTAGAQTDAGRQLAGTWSVVVDPDPTPAGDQAPFVSTIAYTATGSVIESTSRGPSSAGLGTWGRLGAGEFSSTVEKYRFDGAGNYIGRTRISEVQTLAQDGESYAGRATTQILNPGGGVVATFTSTVTATRL